MRTTQLIACAFTLTVAALSLPVMSTPVKITRRQDPASQLVEKVHCSQGGGLINCDDARSACAGVSSSVSFPKSSGDTAKVLKKVGTATVFLTRDKSSATQGNGTALCLQIVTECCLPGVTTISKSQIALPDGERGSIQIVPS